MTRRQRLVEYYKRLHGQPPATTAEEALERLRDTLIEVEDAYSGIPRSDPPPSIGQSDGRMYPPLDDNVKRLPDGGITALTLRQKIRIGPDGSITITNWATGQVEFWQAGGGN
ncbi:MAG TPA: hypothetical protein DDY78_09625 [Planctomycetales bacterium]|jgi:hypothetical protein|nr:hypothetical protein [Planctomycetales bacterium]